MALKKLYASHQSNSSSCNEYFELMSNLRDVISHCGGVIRNHPLLVEKFLKAAELADANNPTESETTADKIAIEEAYMSTAFLSGRNNASYGALLNELHNNSCLGRDEYPKTLTSAYDLAINWKGDSKGIGVTLNDGVAFTTNADEVDVHATDGVKMTRTGKPLIYSEYVAITTTQIGAWIERTGQKKKRQLKRRIPQEQEVPQVKHQLI